MKNFKGKAIYQPSGKAAEYSEWACNFYKGCSNKCTYCYLQRGVWAKTLGGDKPELKKCFENMAHAASVFRNELLDNVDELRKSGFLMTFTSDPFLPETSELTLSALRFALTQRVPVKLLTKNDPLKYHPFHNCSDLVKSHVAFGFTLTGHDLMEPFAITNVERIDSMKKLYDAGCITWASIEPIIEIGSSMDMIAEICNHVDLLKVGLQSGKKYLQFDLKQMYHRICLMAETYGFKVYFKDSFLEQSWLKRDDLPEYCVSRDYNIFNQ